MKEWSTFDAYPESEVECRCRQVFRSHARMNMTAKPFIESRKPCPSCGRNDDIRRVSSDPERFEL